MIGALAQKSWITYYKDKDLSIAFDDIVRVEDVIVEPYLGKKERKALLKKPYRLSNGVWTRVEYKDEIPYTFSSRRDTDGMARMFRLVCIIWWEHHRIQDLR